MTDKPRPDKAAAVAELTDKFRDSSATVLTEYRGLTMSELTTLRRALGRETTYKVSKNTLTKRAAEQAGITGLDDLLVGPTAIAFVGGDPVEAAKGLRDFARTHPTLVIKGGVVDGRTMSGDDIRTLADLESREVLLAKLAGAMKGNLAKAVGLFQAPLSQVARLGAALQEKKAAEPQPAAAAEAPAAEATEG
jgi:large subunit ribosomal protein L10